VIADFLDRETTRIDRLMYAQETLIATLHERRASLISRALSRGTNFEELTIGSGMAGGPEKRRLKWHFSERDERSGEKSAELPLLSVSANWGVRRRSTVTDELSRAEDHSAYKVAYEGDLAINRMLAYQGALGVVPEKGLVSPDYSVLEINSDLNAKWLEYLMRSSFFVFEMSRRVRGIGGIADVNVRTPRLNVRDLGNIAISAPPVREQEAIVDYLDLETVRIDGLIEKAEAFVRIAAERRAALITAAVTGRVDVMEEFIG
jgi:type I restriction enzyme S subunit